MDLNNIIMPASLVADVYKNYLVDTDQPGISTTVATNDTNKHIQYLGKNQQGTCLLVDYPNDVYLPGTALDFLTSILQACRLNLGDVAIVNCHHQQVSFTVLREQLACNQLLIFGMDPTRIGLAELPLFTISTVNSCRIICSPAAEQLNNNQPESKILKSKLWACLKQLFNI